MRTPIRRRQLKGLVLHHRRHPATHSRRLVNRTARWGEPPVNGICRWCYELTASPKTRWHRYCLNAYLVASGRPAEWANPFPIGEEYTCAEALKAFRKAFWACELPVTPARAQTELAAYDYLSCWCSLDQPCHVDEYIRAILCEHRFTDTCNRYCLVCKVCLHGAIAIEGARATCQDCGKTFVGW